jgi:hypothetical protein
LPFGIGTKAKNRTSATTARYLIFRPPKLHFTLNHYRVIALLAGTMIEEHTTAVVQRYLDDLARLLDE